MVAVSPGLAGPANGESQDQLRAFAEAVGLPTKQAVFVSESIGDVESHTSKGHAPDAESWVLLGHLNLGGRCRTGP